MEKGLKGQRNQEDEREEEKKKDMFENRYLND